VLSNEARAALTLRFALRPDDRRDRARLPHPEPTIAQRIVRAKRTLAETRVPFEVPRKDELAARLASVLEVVYLVFNEGYSATAGEELDAARAVRGGAASGPHHRRARTEEPEVHGIVALMEIQASRAARASPVGRQILLLDQDRSRWDHLLARRGLARWRAPSSSAGGWDPTRCRPRSPPAMRARALRRRPTGRASLRSTTRSRRSRRRPSWS